MRRLSVSYDRALALKPDYVEAYNHRGTVLRELKRLEEALVSYDKALTLKPDYAEVYNNRGNALKECKCYEEALLSYDKSLALKPDYAEAHNNRATALQELRRFEQALASHDKAIALKPDYVEAHYGRGSTLTNMRRYDDALASFGKALALRPDFAEAWLGRGTVVTLLRRYDEAFAAYEKALTLGSDLAEAWLGRGRIQMHRGKLDEGRKDFERALTLGANEDVVTYDLARFGAIESLPALPRSVVADIFDNYAESFDEHLVQQLKYDAPANLFSLLRHYSQANSLDILDLGCGTGLMGVQLRSIAKSLVGVDLSQKMLDIAKGRALYDDLICREITEFLDDHTKKYDIVVSTDVLVYFGDLADIFSLVHRNLNDKGYFCFSVEAANTGDYHLRETGRYQHSRMYLKELAHRFGFREIVIKESVIREESMVAVPGFLAVMCRD